MSALICGSMSYDTVMVFNDKFKHNIPVDEIDSPEPFDVHFMVPDLRRQFGGSAGNIAYNLKLLGEKPFPMATVGTDFEDYAIWFDSLGISRDHIKIVEHSATARTFITMDMGDNKMTAFHPGATSYSQFHPIWQVEDVKLGTISYDSTESMVSHALQFTEKGIPFIFDPGHAIFQFDGDELLKFIEQAAWILVNQKEWDVMQRRTNLTPEQLALRGQGLVITQGSGGAMIYVQGTEYKIPSAQAKAINDPVSCGDAFCAGLLYGLLKDADWPTVGRIASLMGAIKVEHHGSQSHQFNLDVFKARFKKNFGYALII
ncbi:carbohydrate kinase family protein [Candidatus Albibeggiatoa sp. nov. BB20]|uniref:carbohydrate kinase family protein n=1 Tax=Candidatus Albibeggiatoa sp. nov. BB20 TaxID=3162723 RepID=UPI003365A1DE